VPFAITAGLAKRVFENHQKHFGGEAILGKGRGVTQEATRRSEVERFTSAVVGQNAPPIEMGSDLTGKHTVWGDQRGGLAIFGGFAEAQCDGKSLETAGWRFEQRNLFGGLKQIGQMWTLG